jgi:hypothetical protein
MEDFIYNICKTFNDLSYSIIRSEAIRIIGDTHKFNGNKIIILKVGHIVYNPSTFQPNFLVCSMINNKTNKFTIDLSRVCAESNRKDIKISRCLLIEKKYEI